MRRSALVLLCVLPFTPVAAGAHGSSAASGPKILFSSDAGPNVHTPEIYAIRADGSRRRNLTRDPGYDGTFVWSPTGDRIAFLAYRRDAGRLPGIYVMNADGSGQRRVTPTDLSVSLSSSFTWSPDGRRLAFSADRADYSPAIWVVGADGSGLRPFVERGFYPVWAPRGNRIAYRTASALEVVDADGGSPVRVADGYGMSPPTWSPDASALAYLVSDGIHAGLYRVASGGGQPQLLALGSSGDLADPLWSPRQDRIAFTEGSVIKTVDAEGGPVRALGEGASPAWSPDGGRIAFATDSGIHVMDADGAHRRKVRDESPAVVAAGPGWSPDGETLLFASLRETADDEIFVVDPNGSRLRRLTSNNVDDVQPSWSHDHTRIAYVRDSGPSIWIMSATGRNKHRLAAGTYPSWSPAGSQLAFERGSVVYTMNDRGRRARRIAGGEWPVWAPRGKRIAFVRGTKVFTANAATRAVRFVADLECEPVGEGDMATTLSRPEWSPRATWLVVVVACETTRYVEVSALIVDPGGAGVMGQVPVDVAAGSRVAWSPTGGQLAFEVSHGGNPYGGSTLSRAHLDGGATTEVTRGAGDDHDPDW
jgi:Tol biopolymer transport system component